MNEKIEAAIKTLADKAEKSVNTDEALKYSQAVLNLAHARATLAQVS